MFGLKPVLFSFNLVHDINVVPNDKVEKKNNIISNVIYGVESHLWRLII